MRASWFRGRYAPDRQLPAEPAPVTEPRPAVAGPDGPALAEPALVEPSDSPPGARAAPPTTDPASVAPVRPVHGHPTF